MSCWRVLPHDDTANPHVPQLLIKSDFSSNHYTVFITDLSNIWSEDLDLHGILERASQQKSPIEVSKHDTTQLAILLENVAKSLTHDHDTHCRITRDNAEGVILHTSTMLPAPLDSLHWRFHLEKQNATRLKNELILPLLVSAHIQHERVGDLVTIIHEKDRAITRLVDHYESSHLDLASAFPSIGGSKPGRRIVKREQAARYIPALRNFEEEQWKKETSQLQDGKVCELGLFQEALHDCNPKVPSHMVGESCDEPWWRAIRSALEVSTSFSKPKRLASTLPEKILAEAEEDETETEDEFETHEHFKLRETSRDLSKTQPASTAKTHTLAEIKDETTEQEDEDGDDGDLDASTTKQGQVQAISPPRATTQKLPSRTRSSEPIPSSSPSPPSSRPNPASSTRAKGFKIGGAKPGKTSPITHSEVDENDHQAKPIATAPKLPKKGFAIGGKRKAVSESEEARNAPSSGQIESQAIASPQVMAGKEASLQRPPPAERNDASMEDSEQEETAEEKAERKRRELKRKNEELAKKQAQKKKKRF